MATFSQILWDNNQLFADIEGLVFSDDKIIEIDYKKFGNEVVSYVKNETTISQLLATYPEPSLKVMTNGNICYFPNPENIFEIGTEIQFHPSSPLPYNDHFLYFGDGGMEDYGFVACIKEGNQFEWSIMFNELNTILNLRIENNLIFAKSKNELLAVIDLINPINVRIKST